MVVRVEMVSYDVCGSRLLWAGLTGMGWYREGAGILG